MLTKGYLYGSHYLPHDALATMNSGKTFLTELSEVGLRNCKVVPRTHDIWIGINRLRPDSPDSPSGYLLANVDLRRFVITAPCAPHQRALLSTSQFMTGHPIQHRR